MKIRCVVGISSDCLCTVIASNNFSNWTIGWLGKMMQMGRGDGNFIRLGTCVVHVIPAFSKTNNNTRKLSAKNAHMAKVIIEFIDMIVVERTLCGVRNQEPRVYVKETKGEISYMVSNGIAICILENFIQDNFRNWISLLKKRPGTLKKCVRKNRHWRCSWVREKKKNDGGWSLSCDE